MASIKTLIALAALAISLQLVAGENLEELCEHLNRDISDYVEIKVDGGKAFAFAKKWIKEHTCPISSDRKLIKAWENIYKGNECSPLSWEHLVYLSRCKSKPILEVLDEPIKAYANKCLTPELMAEKAKAEVKSIFVPKLDLLDARFIEKFYEENPNDPPLHLDWIGHKYWYMSKPKLSRDEYDKEDCCRADRSFNAIFDAIERDLAKRGKDPKTEFYADPGALSKYLERKLFRPCRNYHDYQEYHYYLVTLITEFYEGGQKALIAKLDPETKNILFRYKYCTMLGHAEEEVAHRVKHNYL